MNDKDRIVADYTEAWASLRNAALIVAWGLLALFVLLGAAGFWAEVP